MAMTREEMRDRLEEIARQESNRSAQIQAMRLLREMDEEGTDGDEKPEAFGKLDSIVPGVRAKQAA